MGTIGLDSWCFICEQGCHTLARERFTHNAFLEFWFIAVQFNTPRETALQEIILEP